MVGSHLILTNEASRSGNTPPLSFGPIAAEGSPPVFGGKTDAQHGGDNVHFLDVIWVSLSCCILWLEHRLEHGNNSLRFNSWKRMKTQLHCPHVGISYQYQVMEGVWISCKLRVWSLRTFRIWSLAQLESCNTWGLVKLEKLPRKLGAIGCNRAFQHRCLDGTVVQRFGGMMTYYAICIWYACIW